MIIEILDRPNSDIVIETLYTKGSFWDYYKRNPNLNSLQVVIDDCVMYGWDEIESTLK